MTMSMSWQKHGVWREMEGSLRIFSPTPIYRDISDLRSFLCNFFLKALIYKEKSSDRKMTIQ